MILAAHMQQQLTTAQQIAFLCMIVGAGVILYWIARGVGIVLVVVVYALVVVGWRAHKRGMARLRAYNAREVARAG